MVKNGANAGTVDFKFAQAQSNTIPSKVLIGSTVVGHKLA